MQAWGFLLENMSGNQYTIRLKPIYIYFYKRSYLKKKGIDSKRDHKCASELGQTSRRRL